MNIESMYNGLLNGISTTGGMENATQSVTTNAADAPSFDNLLSGSMEKLNHQQVASNEAITGLITGDVDNLHNVMIQATEAQLSLELAIQVRNKASEAYNDVKNMQF